VHFLVTVAVLSYVQPQAGSADGVQAAEVARLITVMRAKGTRVVEDPVAQAARWHAQGVVDERSLGFLSRAAELVRAGRRARERVELERAEAALAEAEALYAPELGRPGVAAEAALAALEHGIALYELGSAPSSFSSGSGSGAASAAGLKRAAERAFRRAVALEPSTTLTEASVRPELVRAFLTTLRAARRVRLIVRPTAAEAPDARDAQDRAPLAEVQVRVDGQPLSATADGEFAVDVGEGEHLVAAAARDRPPLTKLVEVAAPGLELTVPLPRDRVAERLAELRERPTREALATLAHTLNVHAVVMVLAADGRGRNLVMVAQRFSPGCTTPTVNAPSAAELERRLAAAPCRADEPIAVLEPRALVAAGGAALAARPPRWFERPWVWVTTLSALSLGVVVLATTLPQATESRAIVDGANFAIRR
jgi:hypothetical protein